MNLNATPETIRAVAEALKLAALLDDRTGNADKARIAAWAEQIEPYKFPLDDMLNGVRAYYAGPTDRAIGIGDLIHHAKQARVDRTAKEPRETREARQERNDSRLTDIVNTITASTDIPDDEPPPKYTRHGMHPALAIQCPWCTAPPAHPCHIPGNPTDRVKTPHPSRITAAKHHPGTD